MFLLPNRIDRIRTLITNDDSALSAMQHWLDTYLGRTPYNSGEYAKAYALGYHLTGNEAYLEQAKTLLWQRYYADPEVGWAEYKNRNRFRTDGNRAAIGYAWLRFAFSNEEQAIAEAHIATWVQHWLDYTHHNNDFVGLRITDTDEITSIAGNLTMFGYLLQQSPAHAELGELSLAVADTMFDRFIVDYYMNDIMQGGAWAEGSAYSQGTQIHWMRAALINKDLRGKELPLHYIEKTAEALLHFNLAGFTGVYQYGSVEQGQDYQPVLRDKRYQFSMYLLELLQESPLQATFQDWLEHLIELQGHKITSLYPGIERTLFYQPPGSGAVQLIPSMHLSKGVGLISARTGWDSDATNLFFINRRHRVDHEHSDALNFDLAHRGTWITKQVTAYSAAGAIGNAHNTLLIENASPVGSSNPTMRALADPFYRSLHQDQKTILISAEAAGAYNMRGYFGTVYAKSVNRQLALIGEQTLAIFDTVHTLPEQTRDLIRYKPELGLQEGDEYIRQVTVNQLFQGQPLPETSRLQSFRIQTNEMIGYYQVAWPEQASIQVIDGEAYWANEPQHSVPDNQRKWRLKISPSQPQVHTEVLTFFEFEGGAGKAPSIYSNAASTEHLLFDTAFQPQEKFLLTSENGTLNSDHWFGAGFVNEGTLILFSRHPDQPKESFLQLSLPDGVSIESLYILGWQPEAMIQFDVTQQGRIIEITPTNSPASNTYQATTDGLLRIEL
ncbi:hypothetical protein ABC502_06650 [Alkalimonas sp. NCh-2]|uniref:hypothetical protein n=1 Tax=Alkalimonas sp. NCh-2 TaxID=3144846 RepID=UPI0031F70508